MRSEASIGICLAIGLLGSTSCTSSLGVIRSQIVDEETKRPIVGAVVLLDRTYSCPLYHGSALEEDPIMEAVTDQDGRFAIGGMPTQPPRCDRKDFISVAAPGYLPAPVYLREVNTIRRLRFAVEYEAYGPGLIREVAPFSESIPYLPWVPLWLEPPPRGPLEPIFHRGARRLGPRYRTAILSAQAVQSVPAGPPGMLVSFPGAEFDRLAVAWSGVVRSSRLTLIAQDRRTGLIHNWSMRGVPPQSPIKLPPGVRMVGGLGPEGFPAIASGGEIYFPARPESLISNMTVADWEHAATSGFVIGAGLPGPEYVTLDTTGREIAVYDGFRWTSLDGRSGSQIRSSGPPSIRSRKPVREWLPEVDAVECVMYRIPESGHGGPNFFNSPYGPFYIGANATGRKLVFQSHSPAGWAEVRLPDELLGSAVTACAASREALYVAVRTGPIYRLELSWKQEYKPGVLPYTNYVSTPIIKLTGSVTLDGPAGPLVFSALAIGPVQPDWDSPWQAVYAAAGNDTIYRFSADLKPDQRITLAR